MLPLLFAATVVAPPASSELVVPVAPPPVVTTVVRAPRVYLEPSTIPASDFLVEVRTGGELLWLGSMRVSGNASANYSQQKSDAPRSACAPDRVDFNGGSRSSLTVSLMAMRYGMPAGGYQLRVSWEHPAADKDCDSERSTRTVGLTQSFQLDPGKETVVSGDGGLSVKIRRR